MADLKRTPLFELYQEHNAKTIDFGGWDLPVQFSSIKAEHEAVRTQAGLFDVSHMGEFEVEGVGSLAFLQKLLTNDLSKLVDGQAIYTAMCYENGGTVDDLLVYRKADEQYLVVVNASNIEKDWDWMVQYKPESVSMNNISDDTALLAIQGPLAENILQKLTDEDLADIRPFRFKDNSTVAGVKALVSRTGYTGEDGFELYVKSADAPSLWGQLLTEGAEDGLVPTGLGARDTLRFEAKLALYGQELTKDISPLEAGIGFAVKVNKEDPFIGQDALKRQKEEGLSRKLVGIEMLDKGIPRAGYEVFVDGESIGFVTTGTQSPTLKKNVGLALLDINHTELGTKVEVQVRKKRIAAIVVATPFYKRPRS
ncbi:glycine cleavage system aminomethyltransferase GcvT [Alkalicoccobacillus plakortidis]|uniref:Aminomethyltransferase n=1 Tax=Alkalicoccobacillus plakortidis TaxID=444060 RepID=A0ABT0XGG7_9BACI|nr:glycine cleavage system aminomethyltransferase GcvT [Alkalicoccobacillus plakortidis]MCM2675006.1 glycine cleavage system aminomethyltransferase GcvT [Alkalicoccobacillus plakortidis]